MAELKTTLQKRRRTILETARRAQQELDALRAADRVSEFEEGAQAEHEEYTLARVGEVQRRQIAMIDAALARMETGEYGVCLDCEIDIDVRRLKALPFAVMCTDCATRRERGLVGTLEESGSTL
jgi:DnaK suppressor protein